MRIHSLFELGGVAGLFANMGNASGGNGRSHAGPRKEPGLELIQFPVASEQREEIRGEHHQAIAFPLALAHLDDHAFGIDVSPLELTEFGDPYTGGIEGGEDGAMLEVAWG